ncbi:hypothetical protein CSB09_04085 [Candidatus Gracilibacteria bacterium]|nr:MAG: hypothetical protein CSB09_04085 [Candidatus Gracilibacteria bacterium]
MIRVYSSDDKFGFSFSYGFFERKNSYIHTIRKKAKITRKKPQISFAKNDFLYIISLKFLSSFSFFYDFTK